MHAYIYALNAYIYELNSCFMPDSFSAFKYKICKMTFADYLIGSK